MLKRLRIIPLIAGLAIGVIAVLFIKPQMTVVYKYPTPDTAAKVVYKDKLFAKNLIKPDKKAKKPQKIKVQFAPCQNPPSNMVMNKCK